MVDVGGGVGTASLMLAKNISNIKIVVQDQLSVIEEGIAVRILLAYISDMS